MINTHRVIELKNRPCIIASSSCVGQKEAEGPLKDEFDICFDNDGINQSSWEMAECELLRIAVGGVMDKANLSYSDIGVVLAGDLLNQCSASNYAVRNENVPFAGLFGACSTMAYSTALASLFVDGKYVNNAIAATSSHFCSAEKQFRYPLEYGAQRPPAAQRTVTGAGALLISDNKSEICVPRILFGSVVDLGLTETANMGAAMAPVDVKIEP